MEPPTPYWQETFLIGMFITVVPVMLVILLYAFYSMAGWYVLLIPVALVLFYVVGLVFRKVVK